MIAPRLLNRKIGGFIKKKKKKKKKKKIEWNIVHAL
jgi:hypothetical protein